MQKVREDEPPLCTSCGACCFSELPEYVRVWGVDYDRFSDTQVQAYSVFIGNKCYLRLEDGHCAALTIDPILKTFHCAMYEQRPDACRALERGSGMCRADRAEKGERPDIAIEVLLQRARLLYAKKII